MPGVVVDKALRSQEASPWLSRLYLKISEILRCFGWCTLIFLDFVGAWDAGYKAVSLRRPS